MALKTRKNQILFYGLAGLIAYMPFHYFLCELLLRGTGLDNIVRDVVIIALAMLCFFTRENVTKPLNLSVGIGIGVLLVCGAASFLKYRLFPILNILRTYLVPMLVFYIARSVDFDRRRFYCLNRLLVAELAIIGVYGYFQAFFLGDDFLLAIGFPQNAEGELAGYSFYISHFFGHQRSVGTFVSPNFCGAVLAVAGCALCFTDDDMPFAQRFTLCAMLVLGMMATFSRSAILGFAVAVFFCWGLRKSWRRITKKTVRCWLYILGVSAAFLLFDYLVFKSLFLRMFLSTLFRSFDGSDPSANAHMEHLLELPVSDGGASWLPGWMQSHFGINGPMAEEFLAAPYKVENAFYLMYRELGLPGTLLYFAPTFLLLVKTIRCRKDYPYFVPAAVAVMVLVGYVFLPNVQSFEIPFYLYLFMGFYDNRSVRALYREGSAC